jgi:hypothetical protein
VAHQEVTSECYGVIVILFLFQLYLTRQVS